MTGKCTSGAPALDHDTNILYSHSPMNSTLRRYAYFYGYYS